MIHLLFDTDHIAPVSTEKEWGRVTSWGQSVPAPEFQKLLLTARSDNLPALTEQIASARLKWAPPADVDLVVVKALGILESTEANSVVVTDGEETGPSEIEKMVESLIEQHSELVKQHGEHVETTGLIQKTFYEYMQRMSESVTAHQSAANAQIVQVTQVADAMQKMFGTAMAQMQAIAAREVPVPVIPTVPVTLEHSYPEMPAPIVKMLDAPTITVPELQTLVRLVESLATAQIAMVQAMQEFCKPKKPVEFTMERGKDGKWKVRGQ